MANNFETVLKDLNEKKKHLVSHKIPGFSKEIFREKKA